MKRLTAALIVQNCRLDRFNENLSFTLVYSEKAARQGAKIVVFPEMNLTGYATGPEVPKISRPVDETMLSPLTAVAKDFNITILAGAAEKTAADKTCATQIVAAPDGSLKFYRKIHTAPFEKDWYTAGDEIPLFNTGQAAFGIQLCYDAHFPELSRAMAIKGADIIFIPHASPRGTCREKYDSWLRHLTARGFDNGVYIAACNQTGDNGSGLHFPGITLVIGPDGNVVYHSVDGKEKIHLVSMDLQKLKEIRSHRMRYFLPNRRKDLFG